MRPRNILTLICLLAGSHLAPGQSILFVGNSFTYGPSNYNRTSITDANGTNYGGVPAIFMKMATEGGYTGLDVTIEAVAGQTLSYHYTSKAAVIGQNWDWVVLQEYSTRPVTSATGDANGTNVTAFRNAVGNISNLVRSENAAASILLYETWARPDKVLSGRFSSIGEMQAQLRTAYSDAASDFSVGYAPVGDAFLWAVEQGYANDPSTPASEGPFTLWGGDNYHANGYGGYLSAAIFYATILGGDPRDLPTGVGSAVAGLGLNATYAAQLQEVAYYMTIPEPSGAAFFLVAGIAVTLRRARRRHLRGEPTSP